MVAAIKQHVTVQPGGVIEIRSPELKAGTAAEVIVLVEFFAFAGRAIRALARELHRLGQRGIQKC